ncbi:MAG TPA: c-type cytochrome [Burkholderiaceae bacterium]|nr:c-type cytochrome [Burkholderiaceae bacterium]
MPLPAAAVPWLCAAGCGMMLGLGPLPDDDLDLAPRLLAASVSSPALQTAASLQRGQRLLVQYQCGACHRIPGVQGAEGQRGPSLDRYGQRSTIAGTLPNGADLLALWIFNPQALRPGTQMPAMGASALDAAEMASYLLALE